MANSDHLLGLIDEILDLAKSEAGRMEVEPANCEALEVARGCIVSIDAQTTRCRLQLTLEPTEGLIMVRADPRRLRQLLLNLLGNAIKFTPAGGSVSLRVSSPGPGLVAFDVKDTGIGIAAEDLGRLFQPFVQLEKGLARTGRGTGLGLALVKRFVDLQNGSVSVESVVGQGSTFRVLLPSASIAAGSEADVRSLPPSAVPIVPVGTSARMLRVAVTDDNETNRTMLVDYLRMRGLDAWGEPDGPSLLKRIERAPPDVILMDVQMPGMDGLEATRRIRAMRDPAKSAIPIIGLTAMAMTQDRETCLAAGMTRYQSKPCLLAILPGLIESCVSQPS